MAYWMKMPVTSLGPEFLFLVQSFLYFHFYEQLTAAWLVASALCVFGVQIFLLRRRQAHYGWGALLLLFCLGLFFLGHAGLVLPGKAGGVIEPQQSLAFAWSSLTVGLAIVCVYFFAYSRK